MQSVYKVADVLNLESEHLYKICLNSWQERALHALRKCRTKELGGHIDICNCCNKLHISYNSCRNRHCPTCQGHKQKQWVQKRMAELLPVGYFHVVFTLPSELNQVCLNHPTKFSSSPKHGKWKQVKNKGKFLFPVKAMSIVFRAKYVAELRKQIPGLPQSLYDKLFSKKWVVYAKPPFSKPENVVEYLGRYTHKIAMSNHRIKSINKEKKTGYLLIKRLQTRWQNKTINLK